MLPELTITNIVHDILIPFADLLDLAQPEKNIYLKQHSLPTAKTILPLIYLEQASSFQRAPKVFPMDIG